MSNYSLNNVRRLITHIDEDEYWDFHVNNDYLDSGLLPSECLSTLIDTTNPYCIDGDELLSLDGYSYYNACNNGLRLANIGYTGVDNGLISYRKDRITNEQFYKLYTKSVYEIPSGDTRLHLHKVTGNTELYDYPTSINEDGSIKLNGGFYQGFFRSDDNYTVLPDYLAPGQEWNLYFDLRKVDYEAESNKTLNDIHPDNKGLFFYIGTRAENKWIYLYKDIPLSGTPYGDCEVENDDPLFDLVDDDMVLSAQTYETEFGVDIYSPNEDYILSDNKFLMFDRSCSGTTILDYVGNEVVVVDYKKKLFDGNLFIYMNHTPTGYTVNDIEKLEASWKSESYDEKTFFNDIYNNALAFVINDDGSIGYKYLVRNCDIDTGSPYKILYGSSYPNMIKDNEWVSIHVKIMGYRDGMKLMFYINGKLKYITAKLPMLNLRMLDEANEKQEGVAFNISIGGGTQGLTETILPEYMLYPSRVFPIEENFAGSFIGDIKEFKFYVC